MIVRYRLVDLPTAAWIAAVMLLVWSTLLADDCRAGIGRTRHWHRRVCFLSRVRRSPARAAICCSGGRQAGSTHCETVSGQPLRQVADGTKNAAPTAAIDSPLETSRASTTDWNDLFDGRSLKGWKITNFGGEGEVYVEDNRLMLDFGSPLTGVTYTNELPTSNYEIRLEAQRVNGTDFFCALTFPVGQFHCSFIVGGWGGGVIGLSSIDGRDASENDTTDYMAFASKKWYRIRVRVTDERIQAWINDKQAIDHAVSGHGFDTRPEVELSKPLGLASFDTRAAFRNVQFRRLDKNAEQKPNIGDNN